MMSLIVHLKGLPATAASSDIRQFFCGLNIPRGGISIIGGIYGEAYIVFSTHEDARQAMNLSGRLLKDSFVYLEYSNEEEMRQALEIVQIGLKSSLTSSKSPEKDNVSTVYLYIRGLPIEATWTDIQEFFKGLCVEDILFLKLFNGCRSGKAIAKFGNATDASEAMKLNNRPLRYSPVVLKLSNEEEWNQNGGDHIAQRERSLERSSRSRSRSPNIRVTRQGAVYVQEYYVHLLNLSFKAEKSDIRTLFNDLYIKDSQISFLVDKQGRRTREGFVMFRRERNYRRALTFNKETFMGYNLNILPISKAAMYRLIDHMSVSACNDRPDNRKSPSRSSQERSNQTDKRKSPSRSPQDRNDRPDRKRSRSRSPQDRNDLPDRKRSRSRSSTDRKDRPDRKRSRSRSSTDRKDRPDRKRSQSRSPQDRNDHSDRKRSRSRSSTDRKDRPGRKRSRSRSSQHRKDRPDRKRSRSRSSQDRKDRPERKRSRSRSSQENGHRGRRGSRSRSPRERFYNIDRMRSPERRFLYLRYFPSNVTKSEVRKFFTGLTVKEYDIYLIHEKGVGLGDVLVTYNNEKEASRAEIQNNRTYRGIKILVIRITKDQVKDILANERINNAVVIKADGVSRVTSESLPHVGTSTPEAPVQANAPVALVETTLPMAPVQSNALLQADAPVAPVQDTLPVAPVQSNALLQANAPVALVQTSLPVAPVQANLPVARIAQVHPIVEPSALEEVGVCSRPDFVPLSRVDSVAEVTSDLIQSSLPKQRPHRVNGCDEDSNCDAGQSSSNVRLLFMRNLPVSITATEILDFFRDFKVSSVNLQNIESGEATVCMASSGAVLSAIDTLNNRDLALKQVSLSLI